MRDLTSMVAALKRPRLLVEAARHGTEDYRRKAHLNRLLGPGAPTASGEAIIRLLELEADLNDRRSQGAADYPVSRHVDVMIALMGEVRHLREAKAGAQVPQD